MFKRLSLYFFNKLLVSFLIGIFALSFLLFLMQIARFVETTSSRGLPLSLLFYISSLTMQNLWVEIMPFILAISLIVTWSAMLHSQELVAIMSFGVSYFKLILQPLIFALLLSLAVFVISNFLLPNSYINYSVIKNNIENSYNLKSVEVSRFNQLSENFSFYVKSIDGDVLKEIIIKFVSGNSPIVLFAQTGKIDSKNNEIVLVLKDVVLQEINDSYNTTSFANLSSYTINLNNNKTTTAIKNRAREFTAKDLINYKNVDYVKKIKNNKKLFSKFTLDIQKEIINRVLVIILPIFFVLTTMYFLIQQQFSRQAQGLVYTKIIMLLLLLKTVFIVANNTINNIPLLILVLLILPIGLSIYYLYKIANPKPKKAK